MVARPPQVTSHEGLAPMDSRFVTVASVQWEKTRFPGIDVKTLLVDPNSGLLTCMMRLEAGSVLPDHEHVGIEQTYVLEGRLVDPDGECLAGDFVWRPAGSRHAATMPEGGLLLAMFQMPNRFFDADGRTTDFLGRDYESTWAEARKTAAE